MVASDFLFGSSGVAQRVRVNCQSAGGHPRRHVVSKGDNLELLAHLYYQDSRQWWRIVDANPQILQQCRAFMGQGIRRACDASLARLVGRSIAIPE